MKVKTERKRCKEKVMGSIGERIKKVVGRGELKKNVKRRWCRQEESFRE